ncbi:UdgX family uracil-DNA binding protein [Mesorhizobium sp. INR15]|uniref:UdgX family uracil-DNA binding protein n=1 Tax=Mesorhizobium sp. INR15 TaxID=2654248 RepID=UPI001896718A|nr:UdgX family uracil-DNA binding protein [Mesorhizobium sp. INR15]QPC89432.1 UdgX family uracil-DNA binding protein [Mesorhizobium sp. INR15]
MQPAQLNLTRHSVRLASETDFAGWRDAARRLALNEIRPEDIGWQVEPGSDGTDLPNVPGGAQLVVPRDFIAHAETVFCHSDPGRFAFLYRLLWRLRTEPNLLAIASDVDTKRLETMEKAVRRDSHKMHAFVRFRKIGDGAGERYVAWFEPDHFIVERNADFFVRRFTGMRWTILTPHASADWDGERLAIGPGAAKGDAPAQDDTETLWRTYFENIFNPARLKVKAMQKEMPKKYWRNLPEASLIPELIAGADKAAIDMIAKMPTTPAPHHAKVQARHWPKVPEAAEPEEFGTIAGLREAAKGCRRCPLWRDATQTVFGEGPDDARVVFVGEQPGDQEDLAGKPFVGPAGKVFDSILADAQVDRQKVYVTNAVKHFKFEPRGKRRIHSRPNAGEVQACRWWVDKELEMIKPDLVVALGATAALSLLGKAIPVTKMRGQVIEREDGLRVFITIHPSFILRIQDLAEKETERERFLHDMKQVKRLMAA